MKYYYYDYHYVFDNDLLKVDPMVEIEVFGVFTRDKRRVAQEGCLGDHMM